MSKKPTAPRFDTREAWLNEAANMLLSEFATEFVTHFPDRMDFKFMVSCGFPLRERGGKVIGQAWMSDASGDKLTHHLFVTPRITEPVQVLATLLHELIHAADNNEHKHRGVFVTCAKALGLEGKPTATFALEGTPLHRTLFLMARTLGAYPHTDLQPFTTTVQKTYQLLAECPECGCKVRMTYKWMDDAGLPFCGTCKDDKKRPVRMESEQFDVEKLTRKGA